MECMNCLQYVFAPEQEGAQHHQVAVVLPVVCVDLAIHTKAASSGPNEVGAHQGSHATNSVHHNTTCTCKTQVN
jgi:hypothetical protein